MATDPVDFNEFLQRFDKLSREERQKLIEKLERHHTNEANGDKSGRSLYDALNERGMAGSIKDAPSDWSSNPKYLEGLGQDAE